jgi:hypothetical protein
MPDSSGSRPSGEEAILSGIRRRIARVDPLLIHLATLAPSVGFMIHILLDGFFLTGRLTPGASFTEAADSKIVEAVRALVAQSSLLDDETWAPFIEQLEGGYLGPVERRMTEWKEEGLAAIREKFPDFENIDLTELERGALANASVALYEPVAFSLRDVHGWTGGGQSFDADFMRIQAAAIRAWWLPAPKEPAKS